MKKVLIIAPENDIHALVVKERLAARGVDSAIWNTTWFPWKSRISWTPDGSVQCQGNEDINFKKYGAIWWRRYTGPTMDPVMSDAHVKQFCEGESRAFVKGILTSAKNIINHPSTELHASSKIVQLQIANELKLDIPKTCISNDAEKIREFIGEVDRTICKTIYCDYPHSVPTRECFVEEFEDQTAVALAPVLVQELVECVADIRVFIVGDKVFCGELVRNDGNSKVDWRMTCGGWKPHVLPEQMKSLLLKLIRRLDLHMASCDLRLRPNGEYSFLEVNPSGQFLFLEIDAGLPLTEEVAGYLAAVASHDDVTGEKNLSNPLNDKYVIA